MLTVDELLVKLNNDNYKTDYIVRIRRKYDHGPNGQIQMNCCFGIIIVMFDIMIGMKVKKLFK